ncbi:MAG: hypothetical protein JRJ79_17590 [Deltaproteobacteria bacterium]|nr:hypothetical protein [Deltaproteobacteria bacterium]
MRKKVLVGTVVCGFIMLLSTFSGRGGLHKTEVGCTDCHEEHPPHGEHTIQTCDSCHAPEDNAHYALKDCRICHYPHYPLEIDFAKTDEVKTVCLTCHSDQGEEMEAHPSEHAGLDCKECHVAHGEATSCKECHDAHTDEMTYQGCLRCHKPHRPTAGNRGTGSGPRRGRLHRLSPAASAF